MEKRLRKKNKGVQLKPKRKKLFRRKKKDAGSNKIEELLYQAGKVLKRSQITQDDKDSTRGVGITEWLHEHRPEDGFV